MENSSDHFNIVDLFYESAKRVPDKTAIIYKDKRISFRDFEKRVSDTAFYFQKRGITKGDRVLVFVPMSIDLYRIVLAIFRIGATAVFLDEWVNKKRMEECCRVAQCKAFVGIFKARVLSFFSTELRKIPIRMGVSYPKIGSLTEFPSTYINDTALITFTTGSTGTPKAAKRTHGFLRAQFNALFQKLNSFEDEIDMPALPIVLLMNLGTGTTSVIANFKASKPETLSPAHIVAQLTKYKVTRIIASPFFIKQVAKYVSKTGASIPSLRKILTGGAPVFPVEAEMYVNAFPLADIEVVYGSTESEPISAISANELIREKENILSQGLLVGKVDKSAEVRIIKIIDDSISCSSDHALVSLGLPNGEIGEIIVAGDHVLREYYNNDEALKRNKIFINEKCWHRTADSGYLNPEGNLFLTGRCSTLIPIGKETIAPFIYENYLQTIAGVEIGTILMLSTQLTAIVETTPEADKEAIRRKIKLLPLAIQVVFLKKIPRDPRHNSKIDYQKLKSQLAKMQ